MGCIVPVIEGITIAVSSCPAWHDDQLHERDYQEVYCMMPNTEIPGA